jgi:hypothetical protein
MEDKFRAEDVAQLGSISIATTGDFFFIVVVVAGREKMPEDEGGDVHVFFLVHDDGDALAVVPN